MKINKTLFIVIVCIHFLNVQTYAQNNPLEYTVELNSVISTKNTLPFWLTANTYDAVSNNNHVSIYTSLFSDFNTSNNTIKSSYKASLTGLKDAKNNVIINELYYSAQYKKLQLDLGVKHQPILWEGLSSSNGNIIVSNNARSLPGYNISIPEYIALPFAKKWLRFKGNYGDYLFTDTRIVSNAKLHTKSVHFKYLLTDKLQLTTGLNHYAQWGGNSSILGKQPSSFKDYLRIVSGLSGGSSALEGDQLNALGNHLGSYLVQLDYKGNTTNWNFYYSHPFEDGSGRELQNWRDGLYGVFIDFKQPKSFITHLLTEFTYTKHMSGESPADQGHDEFGNSIHGRGRDNYFNNSIYASGWTYFGNTIGTPYVIPKPINEYGITNGVVVGLNRFMAFNVGLKGFAGNIPYRLMLSRTTYFGWFDAEYDPKPTQFSGYLEIKVPEIEKLPFTINIGTAFDTGTYRPNNFGGFLTLSKKGIF